MTTPLPFTYRKLLFLSLLFCFLVSFSTQASHLRGGTIYYKSDTTAAKNPLRYFFTLVTYTGAPAPFEDVEATLHFGDCMSQRVTRHSRELLLNGSNNIFVNIYKFEHTYAGPGSYAATYVGDSNQGGIVNILDFKPAFYLQSTFTIDPFLGTNHSPTFKFDPFGRPVQNTVFTLNSGAVDADGDSLSYKLVIPRTSNGWSSSCGNPIGAVTPGLSGLENFLGSQDPAAPAGVTLNRQTGLFTWNTPSVQGIYNVAILVEEWRGGRLIGTVTKDVLIRVYETSSTVTSVSEELLSKVSFYPNPAAGVLTVQAPAGLKIKAAQAFNSVGKLASTLLPQKSTDGWAVDVRHLPDGFYLLNLQTDQGPVVQRLVVKH